MAKGTQHLLQVSRYRNTPVNSRLTTILRASGQAAAPMGCFPRPRPPAYREDLAPAGRQPAGASFCARVTIPQVPQDAPSARMTMLPVEATGQEDALRRGRSHCR